jgi:L-ascorbate oxidase
MDVDFSNPTVKIIESGTDVPSSLNSFSIDGAGAATAYWVIQNQAGIAHPIHLHLHDFNIIAQGTGTFDATTTTLNWATPARRDVAMLPANGYLFIAFKVLSYRDDVVNYG